MSAPEHAHHLLRMARKDLRAAQALLDPAAADVETFGFHAQQAAEKALKAWLDLRGLLYPRVHDLDELLRRLTEHGAAVPPESLSLGFLTDFGVAFRYEAYGESGEPFDRREVLQQVERLLQHVEGLAARTE